MVPPAALFPASARAFSLTISARALFEYSAVRIYWLTDRIPRTAWYYDSDTPSNRFQDSHPGVYCPIHAAKKMMPAATLVR